MTSISENKNDRSSTLQSPFVEQKWKEDRTTVLAQTQLPALTDTVWIQYFKYYIYNIIVQHYCFFPLSSYMEPLPSYILKLKNSRQGNVVYRNIHQQMKGTFINVRDTLFRYYDTWATPNNYCTSSTVHVLLHYEYLSLSRG